jgi:hypothetical protein
MLREDIRDLAVKYIKQMPLFIAIVKRMEDQANLGYNYVLITNDWLSQQPCFSVSNFTKIREYLVDKTFIVNSTPDLHGWKISWSLI